MFRLNLLGSLSFRFSLEAHFKNIQKSGIDVKPHQIVFNPSYSNILFFRVAKLYEIAFLLEKPSDPYTRQSYVSSNGALCAYSGLKTGREP